MENELWKPVDFGTTYQVSSYGDVRNLKTGRVLSGTINEDGYRRFYLSENGKCSPHRSFTAHALVMRAFAGPCPDGMQIRHLDGDPLNNRWAPGATEEEIRAAGGNLIYGTPKENCEDRDARHGRNGHSGKTHCGTCGEPYDEENTYVNPAGQRCCRNCVRASGRRWDERNPGKRAELKRERRRQLREERSAVFMTTGEAADLLGCTAETVRRWCKQGILPFEVPGRQQIRLRRADVMRLR